MADLVRRWSVLIVAAASVSAGPALAVESPRSLRFSATDQGGYTFDTGALRGTLCPNGKPQGLASVTHIPTGTRLDRGAGILSYYRVFTTNKRYGAAAWDWPGAATTLLPDGAVQVSWPTAEDRPFELAVLYRWKDPQTIDVETTVHAIKDLSKFETFVASYFDETFASALVYASENPDASDKPGFMGAPRTRGDWQLFPRDSQVMSILDDGRWKQPPYPLTWAIQPRLEAPVGLRRDADKKLSAILMCPPSDCFAMATPYDGETHYSLYPSLFGRDVKAGESATARARLIVAAGLSDEQVLALYQHYLSELSLPPGR